MLLFLGAVGHFTAIQGERIAEDRNIALHSSNKIGLMSVSLENQTIFKIYVVYIYICVMIHELKYSRLFRWNNTITNVNVRMVIHLYSWLMFPQLSTLAAATTILVYNSFVFYFSQPWLNSICWYYGFKSLFTTTEMNRKAVTMR